MHGVAHAELEHHRPGDHGDPLQVVGGARRDLAERELLRRAAAEQHADLVQQLLAGAQVAILLRQVERVAERLPARHDRDLGQRAARRPAGARSARGPPRGRR